MYWVSESDTQVFPAIVADGARCLPLRLPCVFGLETRVWWNTTSHAGHHVPITHGVERCGLHFTVYDPSRRSKSTVVMIDAFLFVTLCVHPQTWPPDSFEVAFFEGGQHLIPPMRPDNVLLSSSAEEIFVKRRKLAATESQKLRGMSHAVTEDQKAKDKEGRLSCVPTSWCWRKLSRDQLAIRDKCTEFGSCRKDRLKSVLGRPNCTIAFVFLLPAGAFAALITSC